MLLYNYEFQKYRLEKDITENKIEILDCFLKYYIFLDSYFTLEYD